MAKYRTYSLILGPVLFEQEIFDCKIIRLNKEKQKARSFKPLEGSIRPESDKEFESYVTSTYRDPRIIKTDWVITFDYEGRDVNSALGATTKKLDQLCAHLSLAYRRDFHSRAEWNKQQFLPYHYQINKIYEIVEEKEEPREYGLYAGTWSYPNHPSEDNQKWHDESTQAYLLDTLASSDEVFNKALDYLYSSARGFKIGHTADKVALDHFKAIELIINKVAPKRLRGFKNRVDKALEILSIEDDEIKQKIKKWWDDRSKGDIAHAKEEKRGQYYPDQFPVPQSINSTDLTMSSLGSIASFLIAEYYDYLKN